MMMTTMMIRRRMKIELVPVTTAMLESITRCAPYQLASPSACFCNAIRCHSAQGGALMVPRRRVMAVFICEIYITMPEALNSSPS
mmetsp:Transcript_39646/g.63605  ORF Transcript_39646/g.63605 Transcript_39646/m.63605 type:complete len:85 (-) Transcript_39646:17-271(-)